jgi:L-cystine uptake protein TcyP (sodium:dicarboxylate symporter family)
MNDARFMARLCTLACSPMPMSRCGVYHRQDPLTDMNRTTVNAISACCSEDM